MKSIHYQEIDSTQKEAHRLLKNQSLDEDLLISADHQSSGLGSRGRAWLSVEGGIYFTVIKKLDFNLLKQNIDIAEFCRDLTLSLAEKTIEVLQANACKDLYIKPINDIYWQQKKLAGILTESINNYQHSFLLIGLGLNFKKLDLSDELIEEYQLEVLPVSLEEILAPEEFTKLDRKNLLLDLAKTMLGK